MPDTSSAYIIALYIRLSTEDSKTDSLSIENQKIALHRYADAMEDVRNAEVLEFIDNGYSGTNFERPAVQELLELVRAGKIQCIIVKDFTRFGRNSIEVGYFMEKVFPIYGVRFISLNDQYDSKELHGDTGGLSYAFMYLLAEFYSRDLSVKSTTAKLVKMKKGEYQSKICPYGYRKGADGRMEPDPETAPNVRLIFQMAYEGKTTCQIAKELFARGICTPGEYKAAKGLVHHDVSRCCGLWQSSSICHILADERYTGTYIIGKRKVVDVGASRVRLKDESEWIKIPDHHPAIVSKEMFDRVRARTGSFPPPNKDADDYALRGKVYCGSCRHALVRNSSAKEKVFRCRYARANEKAPCYGLAIKEQVLEETLYEMIVQQARIILDMEDLGAGGLSEIHSAKQSELSGQMECLKDKKRLLYESLLSQEITLEEYKRSKAMIDVDLTQLEEAFTVARKKSVEIELNKNEKTARKKLAGEIVEAKKLTVELADALIERVYVHPNNTLEVQWKLRDFCLDTVVFPNVP